MQLLCYGELAGSRIQGGGGGGLFCVLAMAYSCKRDWYVYNDWACVECCQGDLCNYYVTVSKPDQGSRGGGGVLFCVLGT